MSSLEEDFLNAKPDLESDFLYANPDKPKEPSKLKSALYGARQGLTFEFGDELESLIDAFSDGNSKKDFWSRYDDKLTKNRKKLKEFEEANPYSYMAGDLGSSLFVPLPGGSLVKGAKAAKTAFNRLKIGVVSKAAKAPYKGIFEGTAKSLNRHKGAIASGAVTGIGAAESNDSLVKDAIIGGVLGWGVSSGAKKALNKLSRSELKKSSLGTIRVLTMGANKEIGEHLIEQYLTRHKHINSAMSRDEIKDAIDTVVNKVKRDLAANTDQFKSIDKRLNEAVVNAKQIAKLGTQKAKDRHSQSELNLKNMEVPDLVSDYKKAVDSTKNQAVQQSQKAKSLLKQDDELDLTKTGSFIKDRINAMKRGGKPPQIDSEAAEYDALVELWNSMKKEGNKGKLKAPDAWELRKGLDYKGKPSIHAGSMTSFESNEVRKAKAKLRKKLSDELKSKNPDIAPLMDEASSKFRTLGYLDDKKITPKKGDIDALDVDKLLSFLGGVAKDNHSAKKVEKVLKNIDPSNQISRQLDDYKIAKTYAKKRELPNAEDIAISPSLRKSLQDKASYEASLAKEARVKNLSPQKLKDQRSGSDIDAFKSSSKEDVESMLKDYDIKKSSRNLSKEKWDDVKSLGKDTVESRLDTMLRKDPTKPYIEPRKQLERISNEYENISGNKIDLGQAVNDLQTLESFSKSTAQGSRSSNTLARIFGATGSRSLEAVGALLGFMADSEGRTMTKRLLDKAIETREARAAVSRKLDKAMAYGAKLRKLLGIKPQAGAASYTTRSLIKKREDQKHEL